MGLRTGFLLFILPYIYPFFFLSVFFVKDIFTPVQDRKFIFGIQNNDKLYRGIENRLCPDCYFIYLFTFLSLHEINTVIFRYMIKIES